MPCLLLCVWTLVACLSCSSINSCGFAGCCLIRLTIGIHHYPDIQNIRDDAIMVSVERACLQLGQQLLLLRSKPTQSPVGTAAGSAEGLSIQMLQQLVREACGGWL
jgi:hypothetical protein